MWQGLGILVSLMLILVLSAMAQHPPGYYYQNWLYAMPWRPLALVQPVAQPVETLDTHDLSLGYTGPQIFPASPPPPPPTIRRPILLGLLRPRLSQDQFTLPFRPSPFAGYSLDEGEQQQQQHQQPQPQQQQQQQQQQQLPLQQQPLLPQQHLEPAFFAPGYAQPSRRGKPIEEPSGEQRQIGEDQQQQYVYMSPSNLYQLVRS
ncbi:hypothetical protein KR222_005379 [Zaprionus bogoriensis]|nr:hypothetical protein KR222_005379 [Zaprionus bogoriensis]